MLCRKKATSGDGTPRGSTRRTAAVPLSRYKMLTTMLVVSLAEDVSTRSNRAAESRTASRDGSCVGQSAGWHGRFGSCPTEVLTLATSNNVRAFIGPGESRIAGTTTAREAAPNVITENLYGRSTRTHVHC